MSLIKPSGLGCTEGWVLGGFVTSLINKFERNKNAPKMKYYSTQKKYGGYTFPTSLLELYPFCYGRSNSKYDTYL